MKNKKSYYIFQMNIKVLNIISIILLAIALVVVGILDKNFLIDSTKYIYTGLNFITFIIFYILYMILHEILHSIAYVLMGAKYDRVIYGVALEKGVLYCLCKQNVTKKNILVSLMTPFILIGIVTLTIALIIKSPLLLFMSIFNISGCAGDLIMFIFISRLNPNIEFTEFDDPISFALYSENDLSKIKSFGLNYIEKVKSIKRDDLTKIKVSTFSKFFLILLIVLLIFICIIYK